MNSKARYHQVALIIETSNEYARGLLHGIRRYVKEHQSWTVYLWEHDRGSTDISWLKNWHGDGIIARIENTEIAAFVQNTGLPAIDLSAGRLLPQLSCFETNDTAIARLAANLLIKKGYQHFAFCGDSQFRWSQLRMARFQECIAAAGFSCSVFDSVLYQTNDMNSDRREMVKWLMELPKPCGVMACYDIQGQRLLEACRISQLSVPDDVGVIGVDNDILLCELSDPSLTSVRPNTLKTGYEAAALLDKIMSGESHKPQMHWVDPLEIIERQSTDLIFHDDEHVAIALKFIHENAHLGINVSNILQKVPVSRRVLENSFRRKLGKTPHDEIADTKIGKARRLLIDTKLPIAQIAEQAGFSNTEYFSVAFKKKTGLSPSGFREETVR